MPRRLRPARHGPPTRSRPSLGPPIFFEGGSDPPRKKYGNFGHSRLAFRAEVRYCRNRLTGKPHNTTTEDGDGEEEGEGSSKRQGEARSHQAGEDQRRERRASQQ